MISGAEAPKLSVVLAARDPDYGRGLLHRFQVFLNGLSALAVKHRLCCELIFVEWNPVLGKPRIHKLIRWPVNREYLAIRIIEVPTELHQQFPNSACLPIFEYIAKNVGIRRARAPWVLATNPDVLVSGDLIRFLSHSLSSDCFYRIDRRDITGIVPIELPLEEQLQWCSHNVSKIHRFNGSFDVRVGPSSLASLWTVLREKRAWWQYLRTVHCNGPEQAVHTNASGDFFLMSRQRWTELRGYTEIYTHAHVDSIMCWTAMSAGLRQVVIRAPACLYHQDHDRNAHAAFPKTDWRSWYRRFLECLRTNTTMVVNDESWGLANTALLEKVLE